MHRKCKHIEGILPRLSGDYPDSLRILSADRSIIREGYPAYPRQVWPQSPIPRPASTPPFGESSKILNSVRASTLAWPPPTVHSNCTEAVCLAARTFAISAVSWFLSNIARFPPVQYCQIPSAIAETALYLRFRRGVGKRGSVRWGNVRWGSVVKQVLNLILPAN